MVEDTRERLVALEVRQEHLEKQIVSMTAKLDEVHSILTQAKGARWAILLVVSLAGFLAGSLAPIARILGIK